MIYYAIEFILDALLSIYNKNWLSPRKYWLRRFKASCQSATSLHLFCVKRDGLTNREGIQMCYVSAQALLRYIVSSVGLHICLVRQSIYVKAVEQKIVVKKWLKHFIQTVIQNMTSAALLYWRFQFLEWPSMQLHFSFFNTLS